MESIGSPLLWAGFTAFILLMLALDLGVFHRKAHEIGLKEAATWSTVWVGLALLFNLGVQHWFGPQKGLEFLTGYLVEKSLSIDNIFVIMVIFSAFAVPAAYQHRVLFWGILGALVMRAIFIVVGAALIKEFHWIIYIFGALLIWTGWKMIAHRNATIDIEAAWWMKWFRRRVPVTNGYRGQSFWVKENGRMLATPLLLVLVAVEMTDLMFAVDSIPAIFAISQDPFIVFTSNIFAILGLRSLYFLLVGVVGRFHYLKLGLAGVLLFVGAKMLVIDVYKVPALVSLGVISALIGASVIASLLRKESAPPYPTASEPTPTPGAALRSNAPPDRHREARTPA